MTTGDRLFRVQEDPPVDLRGYGRSSMPRGASSYEMYRLVAEIAVLVDDCRREANRVQVIGHDWGGAIAREYAVRHSEKLTGVVVLNAPHRDALVANMKHDRALAVRQNLRSRRHALTASNA